MALGYRWGGHVQGSELVDQPLDGGRIGPLVDPVQRRHPTFLQPPGHLLVGCDHQVLDQTMGFGLLDGLDPDRVAVAVELELGLLA